MSELEEYANRLIIPTAEAEKLVARAAQVYVRECPCRRDMRLCPPEKWDVCVLFEHSPEADRQQARAITADEAVRLVRMVAERGDIHQLFYYKASGLPYELCNCCTCCCFPLREAKEKGDYAEQLHSGYVAVTDAELCTGCGTCLDSCFFEARQMTGATPDLIDVRCFGCGRCVADCPEGAIRLDFQAGRGVPIPVA
jgi:ferredoxin